MTAFMGGDPKVDAESNVGIGSRLCENSEPRFSMARTVTLFVLRRLRLR